MGSFFSQLERRNGRQERGRDRGRERGREGKREKGREKEGREGGKSINEHEEHPYLLLSQCMLYLSISLRIQSLEVSCKRHVKAYNEAQDTEKSIGLTLEGISVAIGWKNVVST